ncbi:laminin subunit beta-3-like isoform X1 [Anguilla rostrata]|uniref:laminin subunit beta-3-like isoform X1 n=1 Tax=Anguilla rostrata TaxID=7938 RepID=UPI0030CC596F
MKTWILFQIAALAALTAAQQDCSKGACYPPAGDLLLGRAKQLHASSTCGLLGSEVFCTPYGLTRMKCCPCDSQNPEGPNAHTIQEVLSTSAPHRWWQSRKGVSPVSLQLDLSNPFQLDTLVMKFKGPRPDALIIERSTDFGRTWTPALYMATDCRSTFPSISISMPQNLEHTYCYPLLPITGNHYLDQTIYFYPLRQFSDVSTPNSHKIEEVTDFTNLRVNLTQLGQVPHVPGRSPSRFYALKEMQVLGSCFCHGHANRCLPDHTTNQLPSTQVSPVCECQHNTAGVNCERCAELYNDLPWKHAEEGRPNACKRCECNNHAKRCRFDRKRYEASGRVSGGVCEGCMHNTAGPNCEQCAPNYYRNPRSAIDRTDTCLRCQCSAEGAEQGSQCDSTGACRCKANVEGPRCERCKKGYYGLNAANPLGCSRCQCSAEGAEQGGQCDSTGACLCKANVEGPRCDRCRKGYYGLNAANPLGCSRCQCSAEGVEQGRQCDSTGACLCKANVEGPRCERCRKGYYGLNAANPLGCSRCQCSAEGAEQGSQCDSTGACRCKANVEGPRCERCRKGYYSLNAANPLGCSRCQCSAEGAEQGGQCDSTGACLCKANVEGPRCERCRKGYYGLNAANPLGCSKCSCSVDGSSSDDACDPLTGQCSCPPNVQGLACDRCAPGFWKLSPTRGCERCSCDPTNSLSKTCDQLTGQCQCRFGFGGRTCEECPDNTYGDPDTTCRRCKCDLTGTEPGGCDKKTGQCKCLPGVTGERCDACARGRCDRYPDCPACPSCFFTLDRQLKDFTLSLRRLVSQAPTLPETTPTDLTPRIRALEDTLSKIRDTLPLPAPSDSRVDKLLADLRRLREKAGQLDPELFPTDEVPALAKQLDDLRAELAGLNLDYNSKKDALKNVVNASLGDAFATIKKAYDESTDALKNAEGTQPVVEKSETTRKDATDLEGTVQPTNTADLKNLDDQLASRPNLTPAAKQVCGSTRSTPCTPAQCDGELCPEPGTVSCVEGKTCVGALPLGEKALKDTEEVKNRLQQLNKKIQEAADKIQAAEDSANDVRQSTDDLSNQIKQARNGLDDELGDIKKFVKNLKDFLSDPLLDPTAIQTVSEEILATKLPLSLAALKRKIQEIEKLAAGLPDSSKLLASTTPQLDLARKLLGEAQDARDTALGVKGKVDKLLGDLGSAEELLEDVDGKIQDTLDVLDTVTANIAEAKKKLDPATTLLDEVTGLTGTMLPELDKLKELVQNETENAQKAQVDAEAAKQEADDATKDLQALEDQLELLRQKAKEADGKGEVASGAGERLKKLQEESGTLIQDTMDMMRNLTGAEESLAEATNQLLKKAQNLTGLDKRLQKLLDEIRAKADYMSSCRG